MVRVVHRGGCLRGVCLGRSRAEHPGLPAERALGLKLGGTYNLAMDPANNRLYIGLNGAAPDHKDAWGEIVLFVIDFKS